MCVRKEVVMIDVLIGLILVGLGFVGGRFAVRSRRPGLPGLEAQEQTRLQEDRAAFSQLMGYSADRAYGMFDE